MNNKISAEVHVQKLVVLKLFYIDPKMAKGG